MVAEIEKRVNRDGSISYTTLVSLPRNKEAGTRKDLWKKYRETCGLL